MIQFCRSRACSIGCALRGIVHLIRSEKNAWVHSGATILVVAFSIFFRLRRDEWCWMIVAISTVWVAEAANTALERLCDVASPEPNPLIGQAKNVAAGGVLIAALGAAAIGICVLGPHVW